MFSVLQESTTILVPPSAVEMEENAIGLRLQQGSVSESVTVSVQTAVLRCLYWLEEAEMWWDHGCEVRFQSSTSTKNICCTIKLCVLKYFQPADELLASAVHCRCNHLSSFGGGLLVSPNTLNIKEDILQFTS